MHDELPRDKVTIARLLDVLCVELGFCLPPPAAEQLITAPPPDLDTFTDAVFAAEGLDSTLHRDLRRQVRQRVARVLGTEH